MVSVRFSVQPLKDIFCCLVGNAFAIHSYVCTGRVEQAVPEADVKLLLESGLTEGGFIFKEKIQRRCGILVT